MTIKRSNADIPDGWHPDPEPRFVHLLAEKWAAEDAERGERPHAVPGTRFRHSDAGGCARKLAYKAAGIPRTDPMDVTGTWNTRLGTMIHDAWQSALLLRYPDAEIEVVSQCFDEGSGSMDALISVSNYLGYGEGETLRVSFELKTVGGYKMKSAIGKIRRGTPPEGPSKEHIIQAALNGLAHDADEVVIGYLAKETLSKNYDDVPDLGKFCAEWTLTREQYEPIARLEIQRVEGILDLLDEGLLAARKVPGTPGEIVDPTTSRWEQRDSDDMVLDTGSVWNGGFCSYCSHFTGCSRTQPGRIDVEIVRKDWPT
jgi:hypothetical protein